MRTSTGIYICLCIVVALVIVFGTVQGAGTAGTLLVVGTVIFVVYRGVTSKKGSRECPRCGGRVKIGELDCPHCAFDFRTLGTPAA
jgi:hypothetical protein